jgi:SNF2 family DNA or RNA helicase
MIPAAAIQKYLAQVLPRPPRYKGINIKSLYAAIQERTGMAFRPRTAPRGNYQIEGVTWALVKHLALLFYEMRLGKTWMALNWAQHLRISGMWQGKGLVIVHAPIALDVWEAEAPKHSTLKVHLVRTKPIEFIEALENDCDLIVVPWSGLQQIFAAKKSVKVHKYINKKSKFVQRNKMVADHEAATIAAQALSLVIFDEIHRAKNKATLRFKIAIALTHHCDWRLGLTGTPFGRDPFDLWAQAYLIDRGRTLGQNFNLFRAAFGKEVKDPFGRKDFVFDARKESLLRARMDTLALSYERAEVHDVNILTGEIDLHMYGEQKAAYERAIDHLIRLENGEDGEMVATFVRLRQISSGYLPFTDADGTERVITFPGNPKATWLTDFLAGNPPVQFIIFHEFIRSGELICEVLAEAGVPHTRLYGATRNTADVVRQFNDGTIKVLVANVVKAGMAIDLPVADYVLFWESPTSPVVRQQAEARPMDRGGKLLMIDDMLCSTVERRILSFIKQGRDLLKNLVHDRKLLR